MNRNEWVALGVVRGGGDGLKPELLERVALRVLKVEKGYYVGWMLHGRGGVGLWGLPRGTKVELRTETGVGL